MDASILMLYIPRNRKLEIAPRLSRAQQTRTGRNIHKKQGRVLSPFLVARCFLLRSAHGRAERPSGSVGSWTVQLLLNSRLLLHSQVHLDYTPLEKKVKKRWEPDGKVTASTSPVRCARGHRALFLHCHYETEHRQKRKIKHRDFRGAKACPTSAVEALR